MFTFLVLLPVKERDIKVKDFYSIDSTAVANNRDYTFAVSLNKAHRIYKGHFPQQAVVPGVCMIQMIRELAEQVIGSSLMFSDISNIKFLSLVDPAVNSELNVKLVLDPAENGGYSAKASIEVTGKTFLTLKGNLSAIKTSSDFDFSVQNKEQLED